MNNNIRWLRDKIKMLDLQGIIITNPLNIKYLTGIDAEGTFLITPKENIYITDGRYVEAVNNKLTISDEIFVYDMKDLSLDDYENFFIFCEKVGFEENYVTYAKYKEYMHKYKINSLEETEGIIEKQRMIKDTLQYLSCHIRQIHTFRPIIVLDHRNMTQNGRIEDFSSFFFSRSFLTPASFAHAY